MVRHNGALSPRIISTCCADSGFLHRFIGRHRDPAGNPRKKLEELSINREREEDYRESDGIKVVSAVTEEEKKTEIKCGVFERFVGWTNWKRRKSLG